MGMQLVQQIVVELHTFRVRFAHSVRQNTRPVDGEPVGAEPHLCHQSDILFIVMVVVAGNTGICVSVFFADLTIDHILLVVLFAIAFRSAFALVSTGSGSPQKAFGKTSYDFH